MIQLAICMNNFAKMKLITKFYIITNIVIHTRTHK